MARQEARIEIWHSRGLYAFSLFVLIAMMCVASWGLVAQGYGSTFWNAVVLILLPLFAAFALHCGRMVLAPRRPFMVLNEAGIDFPLLDLGFVPWDCVERIEFEKQRFRPMAVEIRFGAPIPRLPPDMRLLSLINLNRFHVWLAARHGEHRLEDIDAMLKRYWPKWEPPYEPPWA